MSKCHIHDAGIAHIQKQIQKGKMQKKKALKDCKTRMFKSNW